MISLRDASSAAMEAIRSRAAEIASSPNDRPELDDQNAKRTAQGMLDRYERLAKQSGIPPRFADAKLATTRVHPGNTAAVAAVAALIEDGFTKSLCLYANQENQSVGNGKTHLACTVANEAIGKLIPTRFVTMVTLFEAMHEASKFRSDDDIPEIIRAFATVPVLVLDDLGTENLTRRTIPWLEELLNRRWNECKPMIVTSNLDFKQLYESFASACESAGQPESMAAKIADRLRGIVPLDRWIPVVGKSQRGRTLNAI